MDARIVRFSILMAIVLGAVAGAAAQTQRITAREVVAEIQKRVGVEWQKDTVDTFKAGNPDTAVTGIAVTIRHRNRTRVDLRCTGQSRSETDRPNTRRAARTGH